MRKPFSSRAAMARSRPALAAARFAVALAPLLLAVAVLSACRQDPTPQPLPDPITDKPNQSVAASAF